MSMAAILVRVLTNTPAPSDQGWVKDGEVGGASMSPVLHLYHHAFVQAPCLSSIYRSNFLFPPTGSLLSSLALPRSVPYTGARAILPK